MIQRKQTLFLLIQLVFLAIFYALPLANFTAEDAGKYVFQHNGIVAESDGKMILSTFPITVVVITIMALTLITILLFKKRLLQIRFCIYMIILLIGTVGLEIYYHMQFSKSDIGIIEQNYGLAAIIPVACLPLTFLAFLGIRKDELLVKSYDRLR